jgi:hypothetical protein
LLTNVLLPSLPAIDGSRYGPQPPSSAELTHDFPVGDALGDDDDGDEEGEEEEGDEEGEDGDEEDGDEDEGEDEGDDGGADDGAELAGTGLGVVGSGLALVGTEAGLLGADVVGETLGLGSTPPGWPRQWTGRAPCLQPGWWLAVTEVIQPPARHPW